MWQKSMKEYDQTIMNSNFTNLCCVDTSMKVNSELNHSAINKTEIAHHESQCNPSANNYFKKWSFRQQILSFCL